MTLSRRAALDLASDELDCLQTHVSNLRNIRHEGGMLELHGGFEQLESAVARIASDLLAAKLAKVQ